MNQKEQFDYWQRVGRRIDAKNAIKWFFVINLPIAIGLQIIFGWQEDITRDPTPVDLLVRAGVALMAFGVGMILYFRKVFKPAVEAEQHDAREKSEAEQAGSSNGG